VEFETFKEIDDHVSTIKSTRFKLICVKSFALLSLYASRSPATLKFKTLFLWPWVLQGEWSTCFKATMVLRKLVV
jgi:hypothetical protein